MVCKIRDTVMKMLREMDEEGVKQRGKRRLKRRVYRSKVCTYHQLAAGMKIMQWIMYNHNKILGPKLYLACRRI